MSKYDPLRGLGIDQRDSVEDPESEADRDFDLLYLPVNAAREGGILGDGLEADEKRATLPRRTVIREQTSSENGEALQKKTESIYAITDKSIDLPPDAGEGTARTAIWAVYDEWLRFLKNRRLPPDKEKLSLSIFFEDLEHLAEAWNVGEEEEDVDMYVPDFVDFHAIANTDGSKGREAAEDWAEKNDPNNGIHLWRHIQLNEIKEWESVSSPVYYREQSYENALFSYLVSLDPHDQLFQCGYLIRQIIEVALCRVVVVDERVAQTVSAKTRQEISESSGSMTKTFAHQLAWMGVWIVGRIELIFEKNGEVDKVSFTIGEGTDPHKHNGLVTLVIKYDENNELKCTIKYPEGLQGFPEDPGKIEIFSLHQSIYDTNIKNIIDEKFEHLKEVPDGKNDEYFITKLKPNILFTCFNSGRGHPRNRLPSNASFLEYSILQVHLLNRPSKFFFVQQALSSKN